MWTLIFYISAGFGTASTGGPAVIDGFKTQEACVVAGQQMKAIMSSKLDWVKCVPLSRG